MRPVIITCKKTAMFLPYLAVAIGMYIFKNAWLTILLYHSGMVLFIAADSQRPAFRSILKGWNTTWAWIIPASAAGGVAIYFLWPEMHKLPDLSGLLSSYGLTGWKWTLFLGYYSIIHPPLEQFFWRGYLGNPSRNLRVEDIAFGFYHFFTMICFVDGFWALLSCLILIGSAWMWRQMVQKTGGLLIPALSHLIADASIIGWVDQLM
jgi:hypothetical protein